MNKHDLKCGDIIRIKHSGIDRISKAISVNPILKIKEYVYRGSEVTINGEKIDYYNDRWIYNKDDKDKRIYVNNCIFTKASDKDISDAKIAMFEYLNEYIRIQNKKIKKQNKKIKKNKKNNRIGMLSIAKNEGGELSIL